MSSVTIPGCVGLKSRFWELQDQSGSVRGSAERRRRVSSVRFTSMTHVVSSIVSLTNRYAGTFVPKATSVLLLVCMIAQKGSRDALLLRPKFHQAMRSYSTPWSPCAEIAGPYVNQCRQ